MNIGIALRYYRKMGKFTQVQVAENADMNEKYYGELERNESSPTLDKLEKISNALGINIQQIIAYSPLKEVVVQLDNYDIQIGERKAYCNCCGTEFYMYSDDIVCPQCGCEYSEENEYIEVYG